MATITKRTNPSGETVYRAQIRIKKAGYPNFTESKTFSKRALAVAWTKKREAEIEQNPDILFGEKKKQLCPTLREASERYLSEMTDTDYSRNKQSVIKLLGERMLGKIRLDRLRRSDFAEYAMMRQRGVPEMGLKPVQPSTINGDLQYLRTILKHAHFVWGMENVTWSELDLAMEGLRRSRVIGKAKPRKRLPTSDELQAITNRYVDSWENFRRNNKLPMHLIMWFAIYSCRREAEIMRLRWSDYDERNQVWLVRDIKHPDGSRGNNKYFTVMPKLLPIIDAMRQPEMQNFIKKQGGNLEFIFGGFDSRSVSASWRNIRRSIGLDEDLRFHDLRHEGATRLAEDGYTVPQIQQVTLHDDWHVLQDYVNMAKFKRDSRLDFEQAIETAYAQIVRD